MERPTMSELCGFIDEKAIRLFNPKVSIVLTIRRREYENIYILSFSLV
jgi:hypothetical protein